MPPAVRGIGHLSLTVAPAVLLVAAALGAARAVELVPPSVIWLAAVPLIACVSYVAGLEADAVLGGGTRGCRSPTLPTRQRLSR